MSGSYSQAARARTETEAVFTGNAGRARLLTGAGSLAASVIEAACVGIIMVRSSAVALSVGSGSFAAFSTRLHSAPIRIPLMSLALIGSVANLLGLWRGWRLRSNPSSRWRLQPRTSAQRRKDLFVLILSLLTLAAIAAELWAHQIVHPGTI